MQEEQMVAQYVAGEHSEAQGFRTQEGNSLDPEVRSDSESTIKDPDSPSNGAYLEPM